MLVTGNNDIIYFYVIIIIIISVIWSELAEMACEIVWLSIQHQLYQIGVWGYNCPKLIHSHISWLRLEVNWDLSWDCHHSTSMWLLHGAWDSSQYGTGFQGHRQYSLHSKKGRLTALCYWCSDHQILSTQKGKYLIERRQSKPKRPGFLCWLKYKENACAFSSIGIMQINLLGLLDT